MTIFFSFLSSNDTLANRECELKKKDEFIHELVTAATFLHVHTQAASFIQLELIVMGN